MSGAAARPARALSASPASLGRVSTPHEVALLRLAAQRVIGSPLPTALDVVAWLTAVQAQDDAGALTSVALRTATRSSADVVAAFDGGLVVRSWPMRGTLHTVVAADLVWMLDLMTPRPRAAAAKRRPQLGLAETDVGRALELAATALSEPRPEGPGLTRAELLAAWDGADLATAGGRGYHLIAELAQRGVLCLGPLRGGAQRFVLVDSWVREPRRPDRDEALAELALRFFRGHGPATVADLMRWSGLTAADVRAGTAAARDGLDAMTVDGTEYLLDPATPQRLADCRGEAGGVVLLPGFDEIILGYADRSMTLPREFADRIVPGGNGVFRPSVIADGRAVGVWRHVGKPSARRIEATALTVFADDVAAAIPEVYARLP